MHLVSSTKFLIQKLRDEGCDDLITKVKSFCELVNISIPDLNAPYVARKGRSCHQQDDITIEYHYKVNIFNVFNEHTMELLILSLALDPKEMRASFILDDICQLVQKFYP
ncbi:hypothetical protein P3X46_020173 [Hevea brasiliensis]|uniref:Uncharacterized protein n=1 Tax=Hevea brasiliensis TaxID=3981 RepID=A0ABQ9LL36_HEVBR|nr:hypothetical protein P3X46_020173 [Hevea brasiliensis]